MYEDIVRVMKFPAIVWNRYASLVGPDCAPRDLRNDVVFSTLASAVFVVKLSIRDLRKLQLSLGVGDVHRNIDKLLAGPEPVDPTSRNIYITCKTGV